MHRINFKKNQAFHLEDSNLQRMLGILHTSFGPNSYVLKFSVALASGKKIDFDSVEHLLRHDNTVADPIHHLRILARAKDEGNRSECSILFYSEEKPTLSGVSVDVEAEEQRWAASLSAEIEEQIERIKMPGIVYKFRQSALYRNIQSLLFLPLVMALALSGSLFNYEGFQSLQDNRRELLRIAESAKTTDEKIDFLVRMQTSELRKKESASLPLKLPSIDFKLVLGLLPVIISLAILWYLFKYCYPPTVFDWGDSGKEYQRLLDRRKNLWSTLITVIVLGFLINISSPVILGWIGVSN